MTLPSSRPLKTISLGLLLDHFLASQWPPATRAQRIFSPSDLPVRVEQCIRSVKDSAEWRAYADAGQVFCAVARMGRPLKPTASADTERFMSAERLEVYFLDEHARICAAGSWGCDRARKWHLDSVLNVAADRELPSTVSVRARRIENFAAHSRHAHAGS